MGKESELWDDSALVKAFDSAISKYKEMHHGGSIQDVTEDAIAAENSAASEADNGSHGLRINTEHVETNGQVSTSLGTMTNTGEATDHVHIKNNPSLELASGANTVDSSNSLINNLAATSENPALETDPQGKQWNSFDVKCHNETTLYSNGQEEYNHLLSKYYEIEDQRQRVLQKLNQYSDWNYHSQPSASEEYQASVPQTYNSVACYCPYGCQNWVVPCTDKNCSTIPGDPCTDKNCSTVSKGAQKGNCISQEHPDIVKTGMLAAERALSSLTLETSSCGVTSANAVTACFLPRISAKEQSDAEMSHFAESLKPTTDLSTVLNAWYSAGFYTGKYLSEQSVGKNNQSQGQ